MAERVLIVADTEGLEGPFASSPLVFRFGAGTRLDLLRNDDPRYFKVAFDGRPVFVSKEQAELVAGAGEAAPWFVASQAASSAPAAASSPRRVRITTSCTGLQSPHDGSPAAMRFGAGSLIPLLNDGDLRYFEASHGGQTVFIPRAFAVVVASEQIDYVTAVAPKRKQGARGFVTFLRVVLLLTGIGVAITGVSLAIAAAPVATQIENSGSEGLAYGIGGATALAIGLGLIWLSFRRLLQFALVVTGVVLAFGGAQLLLFAIPMSRMATFEIDPDRAQVAMTWAGGLLVAAGLALAAFVIVRWVRSPEARANWPQGARWTAIVFGSLTLLGGASIAGGVVASEGETLTLQAAAASGAMLPLAVIPGGILLFYGATITGERGGRPFRIPAAYWPIGLFIVAVAGGGIVTAVEGDATWLLSPAHALAALMPAVAAMALASRGGFGARPPIARLSYRRAWLALATGTVIVTTVAGTIDGLIAETLGVALLAGSGAFDGLRTFGDVNDVFQYADLYLSRGEQAFLAVTIVVVLAPIMEEGFKGLFTALAMPRRATAAAAFATGVAVGAGFGVLEASLYGLGGLAEDSTIDWWALMLIRAGATSMHALNTGLLGLALFAGIQGRGLGRALAFYAAAVCFHALWNGLSVLAGSRFIFEFEALTDTQLSWIVFGILGVLGLAVIATLAVVARRVYAESEKVGDGVAGYEAAAVAGSIAPSA